MSKDSVIEANIYTGSKGRTHEVVSSTRAGPEGQDNGTVECIPRGSGVSGTIAGFESEDRISKVINRVGPGD